jgi:hypothetical protein
MLEKNDLNRRKYYYLVNQLDSIMDEERTFIRIRQKQHDLNQMVLSQKERYFLSIVTIIKKALGTKKS